MTLYELSPTALPCEAARKEIQQAVEKRVKEIEEQIFGMYPCSWSKELRMAVHATRLPCFFCFTQPLPAAWLCIPSNGANIWQWWYAGGTGSTQNCWDYLSSGLTVTTGLDADFDLLLASLLSLAFGNLSYDNSRSHAETLQNN
jgi:hypothetical protein